MARPESPSHTAVLEREQTSVYGVSHHLKEGEAVESSHAGIVVRCILKSLPENASRKEKVALELTSEELDEIRGHTVFSSLKSELERRNEHWRVDYFRFWHAVVHSLDARCDLVAIDHAGHKRAQDDALVQMNKPENAAVNDKIFAEALRNLRARNDNLFERLTDEERFHSAIVGLGHFLGNAEQGLPSLERKLNLRDRHGFVSLRVDWLS